MNPEQRAAEVDASERRMAAFHEAGHEIVCVRLGGVGRSDIWPNTFDAVNAGQKAWLGMFHMMLAPDAGDLPTALPHLRERWRVLGGLAGLAAEQLANSVRDPDVIASEIEASIELEEVSPSDHALMGDRWDWSDVATVVDVLLAVWNEVERSAAALQGDLAPQRI